MFPYRTLGRLLIRPNADFPTPAEVQPSDVTECHFALHIRAVASNTKSIPVSKSAGEDDGPAFASFEMIVWLKLWARHVRVWLGAGMRTKR